MHAEGAVAAINNAQWIIPRLNPVGAVAPRITLCPINVGATSKQSPRICGSFPRDGREPPEGGGPSISPGRKPWETKPPI